MTFQDLTTYVGVAHPWMCDTMGHMNVRHYAAMFDDASFQLLGHIAGTETESDSGRGGRMCAPRWNTSTKQRLAR